MAAYRRGASGQEVVKIQRQLQQLGLYSGPLDGQFGGGTESAVSNFQRRRKLTIARGEGEVHGLLFNLEEQFGIGLTPYAG